MRGNLDCLHFPLTGYPSCDIQEWERIFSIYKSYGLNHVRFHSWCPPEAAFTAADRIGMSRKKAEKYFSKVPKNPDGTMDREDIIRRLMGGRLY